MSNDDQWHLLEILRIDGVETVYLDGVEQKA